jgi:pyruvate dehydrogenase complex dehydrogenase (E1) component
MSEETAHDPRHCLCCEANDALDSLFRHLGGSEQVREHFRQSRIEFLKGVRSLLDERIERLGRSGHKGTRVVVE